MLFLSISIHRVLKFLSLLQASGLPWTLAKGQDTFTPISSVVSILLNPKMPKYLDYI